MEIEGYQLISEARRAVTAFLADGAPTPPDESFRNKYGFSAGVFVTITLDDALRGCIGYVEPEAHLCDSLPEAAIAAATRDPRFPSMVLSDMDRVSFEVTILEPPRVVKDIIDIEMGVDGLLVRGRGCSGLLLPQVATQYGWSAEEFLDNTCRKAGLPTDAWRHDDVSVWRFAGRVFSESHM